MSEPRIIDARGMSEPMSVKMASEALKAGCADLTVLAGDIIAVECLTRLSGEGMEVGVSQKDGCFAVTFRAKK